MNGETLRTNFMIYFQRVIAIRLAHQESLATIHQDSVPVKRE